MKAAAWTVINRVSSPYFPNTVRDVLLDPEQYWVLSQEAITNAIADNSLEKREWEDAQQYAQEVVDDYQAFGTAHDSTEGAIFFVNVKNTEECRKKYKDDLAKAGVTSYMIFQGKKNLLFTNRIDSVVVPDGCRP